MKSMSRLCTGHYFISMGTTDVAVNLIYEKRKQTTKAPQTEGFIIADNGDTQYPKFQHSFTNDCQMAKKEQFALEHLIYIPCCSNSAFTVMHVV